MPAFCLYFIDIWLVSGCIWCIRSYPSAPKMGIVSVCIWTRFTVFDALKYACIWSLKFRLNTAKYVEIRRNTTPQMFGGNKSRFRGKREYHPLGLDAEFAWSRKEFTYSHGIHGHSMCVFRIPFMYSHVFPRIPTNTQLTEDHLEYVEYVFSI